MGERWQLLIEDVGTANSGHPAPPGRRLARLLKVLRRGYGFACNYHTPLPDGPPALTPADLAAELVEVRKVAPGQFSVWLANWEGADRLPVLPQAVYVRDSYAGADAGGSLAWAVRQWAAAAAERAGRLALQGGLVLGEG